MTAPQAWIDAYNAWMVLADGPDTPKVITLPSVVLTDEQMTAVSRADLPLWPDEWINPTITDDGVRLEEVALDPSTVRLILKALQPGDDA